MDIRRPDGAFQIQESCVQSHGAPLNVRYEMQEVSRYKQVAECAKTSVNKTAVVLKNSG